MTTISRNLPALRTQTFNAPPELKATEGNATAALAWVRAQVPSRSQGIAAGPPPLAAAARTAPAPITSKTATAAVVGSLQTALGNLEHELKGLRPHQTEQFLITVGTPKATVPPELQPAHRALTQALESFEAASSRKDFDQVHTVLSQVKPPYTLSNELLGLGLGSVQAHEAASQARTLLVDNRSADPALNDIRYMDVKSDGTLHIQHQAADEGTLRAAVGKLLDAHHSKAEVSFQRMGEARPSLSPKQYERALQHAGSARSAIVENRAGNAPLDDIAYLHIKEDGTKPPTLLVEHFSGNEAALKGEVDALLRRRNLDVDVAYRQLGPKPPLTEQQYIAALDTAGKARELIMAQRSGNKTLDAITYMHIKEGGGTAKPPTLRIESDGKDGGALKAEVLNLLRRNRVLGDVEFGLTGGR